MKKVFTFSLAALAALAFSAGSSFACGEKSTASTSSKTDGKLASSGKLVSSGKLASSSYSCSATKTTAKLASTGTVNSDSKACAYKASYANLPVKAQTFATGHDANCKVDGGCQLVNISIKGMTCDGCADGVKDALAKIEGVNHVINVDYEEGIAQVCAGSKADRAVMTTAVSSSGFEAQIIPAVAKSTTISTAKTSLSNTKGAGCAAARLSGKSNNVSAKTETTTKKVSDSPVNGDTY